jgi:type IV pilus assembly protein PilM
MAIPSSASLVFVIELPASITERDLASVVPTEARKFIPVPISEVTLDYWVIPQRQETFGMETEAPTKTEVLVAAIHNDTLAKYRQIAETAGLNADMFEIEIFSAVRSTFSHELSAVLLVDVGATKTKLAIVEYGIVRSFHIINRGSATISTAIAQSLSIPFVKAEEMKRRIGILGTGQDAAVTEVAELSVSYILSETTSVIQNFERKYNKPISKVILSGAGALLPGFLDRAQATFRTETVLGNPFEKVQVPEFVAGVLKETGPEFSVALGLALRKLG